MVSTGNYCNFIPRHLFCNFLANFVIFGPPIFYAMDIGLLWVIWTNVSAIWGEILRPPENSVPQTMVFRNKEIGDKFWWKHRKKSYGLVLIFLRKKQYLYFAVSYTIHIYRRFLDSGVLWFAEHYFPGD
jgi:hypothetical protein